MSTLEHLPIDASISESWPETGATDVAVITIPGLEEPLVVEWRGYRHPDDDSEHYVGTFALGTDRFQVKERYEYMYVDERGTFRQRYRSSGVAGCCTELVRELASGQNLALEQIERGAYRGMWRCDIHVSHECPSAGVHLEEQACRVIFNFDRRAVLLFRWCYIEWE